MDFLQNDCDDKALPHKEYKAILGTLYPCQLKEETG